MVFKKYGSNFDKSKTFNKNLPYPEDFSPTILNKSIFFLSITHLYKYLLRSIR